MKALELNFNQKDILPGYVLAGDDESLKSYVIDSFVSTIPEAERAFALVDVDLATNKDANEVLIAADSFAFASCKKMIRVSSFSYKFSSKEEKLITNYFNSPNDASFILFEGTDDLNNLKILSNCCEKIDCNKASDDELYAYILKKLKDNNFNMGVIDIREFIRYCNNDFGKINTELSKLMLYCFDSKKIGKDDYMLLTAPDLESNVFALINALNKNNYEQAINLVNQLRDTGTTDRIIFKTLQASYRKLFYIACTQANNESISTALNMSYSAIDVNKRIIQENKKIPNYIVRLKNIVEYMYGLESKMLEFVISESVCLNLTIEKIIEIMEIKKR